MRIIITASFKRINLKIKTRWKIEMMIQVMKRILKRKPRKRL